ncbi:TB2/DP1, HVA22 family-domain-containing protein [Entophlyctis helioformis]|nr:TB2/DP1, HVA22 family-domain-containing protein [Entophlyctis helioformis]
MSGVPLPAVSLTTTNLATVKARINKATEMVETFLGNIPPIPAASKTLNITKIHVVLLFGVVVAWVALILNNVHGAVLTDIVAYSYPAYASIKAVDSGDKVKYTHWLAYWVIFGLFKVLENFDLALLKMLPYYYFFKMSLLLWAMSNHWQGAYVLFHGMIKHTIPFLDKTFGKMLGGVLSTTVKSSAEAKNKAPEVAPAPSLNSKPVNLGGITLTGPGYNFKTAASKWNAQLGLRGR